jgi:hypothetical protein
MDAVWDDPPFLVRSQIVSGRRPLLIHNRILIRFFRNMPVFSVFFLLPNVNALHFQKPRAVSEI